MRAWILKSLMQANKTTKARAFKRTRQVALVIGISALGLTACGQATSTSSAPAGKSTAGAKTTTGSAYPTHAITLIVPFAAGSAPDTTARKVSEIASTKLGVSINVEDVPGAGGAVGLEQIASSTPDGYTIGYGAVANVDLQPQETKSGFSGPNSLTPIAQVDQTAFVIVANASSGINNLSELVKLAKASPGKVRIATDTTNSIIALDAKLLGSDSNATFDPVPLGAGHQIIGVLNGTAQAAIAQTVLAKPYIQSGKLKVLAVLTSSPVSGIAAPTAASQGFANLISGYEFIAGPKGLPANDVARLDAAFKYAVDSSAFKSYAQSVSLIELYKDSTQLASELKSDYTSLGAAVKKYGL